MKPFMRVTKDFTKGLTAAINDLQDLETLVGIPANKASRKEADGEINNAALLYINNFGSPKQNIPARPVMDIGIAKTLSQTTEELKSAALKALEFKGGQLEVYYERIGIIASNSVKQVINDQEGIEPISFSTELARKRRGFMGEKALVVTGQMRNAITYVVRSK